MPEATQSAAAPPEEAVETKDSLLESILNKVDVRAPEEPVQVGDFGDTQANAEKPRGALMAAALSVFLSAVHEQGTPVEKVDKVLLDSLIGQIDQKISLQLDAIMHHPKLQELESAWRGLKFVVDRTNFRKNIKLEVLNVAKDDLRESFEDAPELIQSALYKHVYTKAYDQPGANPYSVMVSNYEFTTSPQDVALLQQVSKVAASAHCPFIGAIGPEFFGKKSFEEWKRIPDLEAYTNTADFMKWNAFRDSEDARYVGLTFPRFMLRLPYGPDTVPTKSFTYAEDVKGTDHDKYLWGNAAFAFAANMNEAFMKDGWSVQIRGPQSGGKVADLPIHLYDVGKGKELKIPTEVPIGEELEFTASNLGFIPLSIYEGQDYAVFFAANSTQRPKIYDDPAATANSRVNARLPYIMLASRIAHYLKVLQRENIGTTKDAQAISDELNRWLGGYVTKMPNPDERTIAKYPLKDGQVTVSPIEGNPGFFRVDMMIQPHFQVEGMDINLSLVGKIPR